MASAYRPDKHPVCLWELSTGKVRKESLLSGEYPGPVTISPDGKLFAAAEEAPNRRICVWHMAGGKEVATLRGFRGTALCLAFTPDGTRLVSGMSDTTALVWDLKASKK